MDGADELPLQGPVNHDQDLGLVRTEARGGDQSPPRSQLVQPRIGHRFPPRCRDDRIVRGVGRMADSPVGEDQPQVLAPQP